MHTNLDKYLGASKEGAEPLAVLSGREQRKSRLLAYPYDI